jgi:hypothetical protein
MSLPSRHSYDVLYELGVMMEERHGAHGAGSPVMFLMGCKADHARCTERVRELTVADPLNVHFVRGVWALRYRGQLTDDDASRNPTLAAAWALAMANPQPNLEAFWAAQGVNAAEAEEAA